LFVGFFDDAVQALSCLYCVDDFSIAMSKAKNGITSCQADRKAKAMDAWFLGYFYSNASGSGAA
jgi:hypothetical protein